MLSYATLDAIADSYNPLLLILSLISMGFTLFNSRWRNLQLQLIGFATVAVVAYGLMLLDKKYGIWPQFGLDYSTHTATSLGMVLFLSYCTPRLGIYFVGSFLAYALLMLYQKYHTPLDIISTGLAVGPLIGISLLLLYRAKRDNTHKFEASAASSK